MLKVQDKPFTNIEDITKINMVTQNVVVCISLPAGINLCGHSADCKVTETRYPLELCQKLGSGVIRDT